MLFAKSICTVLLPGLAFASACNAKASTAHAPSCPLELPASSVHIDPVAGWTSIVPTRLMLSGAGVVIDDPASVPRAELRGDARRVGKDAVETVYPGLGGEEKWLVCAYGLGGEVEQAVRLEDAVERCVVRVSRERGNRARVRVSCTVAQRGKPTGGGVE